MSAELVFEEITEMSIEDANDLTQLLVDVVADGASIGFLPPLDPHVARVYWSDVLADNVVVWVARLDGVVVGSIQLHLATKQNAQHRAEIAKLMVHPTQQRKGMGRTLMAIAEKRAREENRTLLVLDTREKDPSNLLYQSIGYTEAGRIPFYAESPGKKFDASVFYYKILENR
ncbi:GNAT family N-acetyltransferase [Brevibacillus centrosporus]|uniref:Acetyltransferase (GNAT) family protein n=1 Tax=Brevibacillus centrosporus TaxID=54910 RepID=A0A1I4CQH6_9BACL|nr:GNAT family N-acetyltransferase [Brevibacillus centrosporus]MED4911908.1 GNAT family N-acetyltransferase [Brevibacillus centrosporus]SFK83554.1 Acetyltransferase (GNAT) family protein [Brevibacillus centrosporus]